MTLENFILYSSYPFPMDEFSIPQNCSFIPQEHTVILNWKQFPKNILVVHKFCDESVIESVKSFVAYVLQNWNVTIFLEPRTIAELWKNDAVKRHLPPSPSSISGCIQSSSTTECASGTSLDSLRRILTSLNVSNQQVNERSSIKQFEGPDFPNIDLVVCLGGDGTLLTISSMFQGIVPPVVAFRLGTLGFLTPFPFRSFPFHMRNAIEGTPNCLLRMRLCCQIVRNGSSALPSRTDTSLEDSSENSGSRESTPDTEYHFLNDLVIDRGLSPFICDLTVKVNGRKVTEFEGDGLIVSTPTGSTAYSMATGASLLHPWVPAILLTPINSLALSSRAIVLPINLRLEIGITPGARCRAAHFSFDGRSRESNLIHVGDSIVITSSPYPIPCLCGTDQAADWFCGLNCLLNWNTRLRKRSVNLSSCLERTDD